MSKHLRRKPGQRWQRLRALLGFGVLLGVGATGTFAFWTDDVTIAGTTFTAGTLDLQVNNSNAPATTTLAMPAMVPGSSSAEVLTVKNNGTAPLKFTMTGGLTGTDAAAYATAGSLKLTVVAGGSKSGTGSTSTCTGGATVVTLASLTATTTTGIITTPRGPLAAAGTEALCFQVTLDSGAPSSLQGKTATATFTLSGTSDVS